MAGERQAEGHGGSERPAVEGSRTPSRCALITITYTTPGIPARDGQDTVLLVKTGILREQHPRSSKALPYLHGRTGWGHVDSSADLPTCPQPRRRRRHTNRTGHPGWLRYSTPGPIGTRAVHRVPVAWLAGWARQGVLRIKRLPRRQDPVHNVQQLPHGSTHHRHRWVPRRT